MTLTVILHDGSYTIDNVLAVNKYNEFLVITYESKNSIQTTQYDISSSDIKSISLTC